MGGRKPPPVVSDLTMAEFETINDKCTSELQLLQQMHTAANLDVPLEKILKMVVDSIRNVLDYAACDIYLLEDDDKSLRLKVISIKMGPLQMAEKLTGLTARNLKIPLYEGSDLLDVIKTKKAIISEDMTKVFEDFTDNRAIRLLAPKVAAIFGMKAAIRAPLMVKGKVIGIMGVARKDRITEQDLSTLERFASSVALTINKAMAEEDLRSANVELKTANERLSLEFAAREENEKKLNRSELRFQHFFENAAVGMVLMDSKGRLVEVNRTLARMLGYDRDDLVGMHFGDLTYPDDLADNITLFDELIRGKRDSFQMEKRCLTRDKEIVWGHISAALFEMGEDNQKYLVTVIKDITDRKRAEEAIAESEKRYNLLLDNTDTGFVVIDEEGVVLEANEPYLKFAGAGRLEDIKGRSVMEWTAPECIESNVAAVGLCAEQGYIKDFETTYLRPNGSRCVIQIDATVQETPSGKQIHSFCRDITERKMAEEAIFYSQEVFSKAFKNSPLAMVIGDYNTSEIIDTN
ncbi:MAG: PAS domain S-box protein, partial [Thermodesulfovibrionales bacterium]|nr:PAS domain S-box protein [Thermodesulfovibrionales bacterium]